MELTEPEMAYLRRFSSETANNIFGPGSIFNACLGYIDDLVFLSIPKAQWEIDWNSHPIPLTPEVPFPWASLEALHERAEEARRETQKTTEATDQTTKSSQGSSQPIVTDSDMP